MRKIISAKILYLGCACLYAQDNFNGIMSTYGDHQFKGLNGIMEMQYIEKDSSERLLNGILTIYEPQPEKFSGKENGLMDTHYFESGDTTKKPEKIFSFKNDSDLTIGTIFFEINSSKISQESITQLRRMLTTLQSDGVNKITIMGYTDASGSLQYNQTLSNLRAESIKKWLILNGIDQNKIIVFAMGPEDVKGKSPRLSRKAEIKITLK